MRRFSSVASFLVCILLGMFLGYFIGIYLVKVSVFWLLRYARVAPLDSWVRDLLTVQPATWRSIEVTVGLLASIYLGAHLGAGSKRFFWLLDLKRIHRMTFFEVSRLNPISNNLFMDIIWAIAYSLAELILPDTAMIVTFAYIAINFYHDLGWLSWVMAILMAFFVKLVLLEAVHASFAPQRLQWELQHSALILNVLRAKGSKL